jgi:hypothetical protein
MTLRSEVYNTIDDERDYQDAKWGGPPHDQSETVGNFLIYLERYLVKAKDAYVDAGHSTQALHEIRKIAALAVCCMEVHWAPTRDKRRS